MRFAYIDSQGNEVPIPSLDALALRIELGAIGPDTELYDAQADHWGPAHTHEIFHTLQREQEEGFVVPPPPVAPLPTATDVDAAAEPEEVVGLDDLAPAVEGAAEAAVPEPPPAEPPPAEAGVESGPAVEEPEVDLDFTLTDMPGDASAAAEEPMATEEPVTAPEGPAPGEGDPFDFGGVGELVVDAPQAEPPSEEPLGGMEMAGEVAVPEYGAPVDQGFGDTIDLGPAADDDLSFGGGMELEQPLSDTMDFGGGMGTGDSGLELETPMSAFDADSPPAWMEQGGDAPPDATLMDDGPPGAAATGDEVLLDDGRPVRERPTSRSRPSPPKRVAQRNLAGPVIGVLAVAAIGVGGWFGWNALQSGGSGDGDAVPQLPPVTIPDIPAELLPTMRDLGEDALSAMIADLGELQRDFDLPVEPREEWLSGDYLANASDFADIQQYWLGIEAFVDRVREVDTELFHERYVRALADAGISGDEADILLERADSGFLATRQDRFEAYAQMDDLVNASLDLHTFLRQNESSIAYDPAAGGVSRDPVLEAIPATQELGDQMWDMVDSITGALDALGTLDRVTTERLLAVLFDRIRRAGFQ